MHALYHFMAPNSRDRLPFLLISCFKSWLTLRRIDSRASKFFLRCHCARRHRSWRPGKLQKRAGLRSLSSTAGLAWWMVCVLAVEDFCLAWMHEFEIRITSIWDLRCSSWFRKVKLGAVMFDADGLSCEKGSNQYSSSNRGARCSAQWWGSERGNWRSQTPS